MAAESLLRAAVVLLAVAVSLAAAQSVYTASVLQHNPINTGAPADIINANLALYEEAIALSAQHGAQIVVTPEFGITGGTAVQTRAGVVPFAEWLPSRTTLESTNVIPCENALFLDSPILQRMSCAAANASVYLVVNMVDAPGNDTVYNTAAVFDPTGALITKYWKSHPWYTKTFTKPAVPDLTTFEARFDDGAVTFALMICFDIAFGNVGPVYVANGVRHFPYASAESELGPDIVGAFSKLHSTAMLASNMGDNVSSIYVNGTQLSHEVWNYGTNGDSIYLSIVPFF
eukprot:c48230_g1_i1.p1 GENE.c48230_g1_i1~~c48230_g1_i1.p1  ORF type:complete len:288 (-),score=58.29 c48230_g1_i1:56-919(-)